MYDALLALGNDTSADTSKYKPRSNVDFKDKHFFEILENEDHELHKKVKYFNLH